MGVGKKIGSFIILLTLTLSVFADQPPIGLDIRLGGCYTIVDPNTAKYFQSPLGGRFHGYFYIQKIFIGISSSSADSYFKDSLKIGTVYHLSSEKFGLDIDRYTLGYSFFKVRRRYSINPYLGVSRTVLARQNRNNRVYDSKIGYSLGLMYNVYFNKKGKSFDPYMYIDNTLTYSNLQKINGKLGNLYYTVDVGIGFTIGNARRPKTFYTKHKPLNRHLSRTKHKRHVRYKPMKGKRR